MVFASFISGVRAHPRRGSLAVIGLLLLALIINPSQGARAATIVVDINDPDCGLPGQAYCDVQSALLDANAGDTILVESGTYTGHVPITKSVTISGADAATTIFDGEGTTQVVSVSGAISVTISGITIRNGRLDAQGGAGVYNGPTSELTLSNSAVVDNVATNCTGGGIENNGGVLTLHHTEVSGNTNDGLGGGIFNAGTLMLNNSLISLNHSTADGGGIWNGPTGSITLTNSTIVSNTADFDGGGIESRSGSVSLINSTVSNNTAAIGGGMRLLANGSVGATASVVNSTFSGNTATSDHGGGIVVAFSSMLHLQSSTITANNASGGGAPYGGGLVNNGTTVISSTIIAANTSSFGIAPDCSNAQTLLSGGYNLIGNNADCGFTAATGDQVGTPLTPIDPLLESLRDNGGPTLTHALLAGSPALNAGAPSGCPATDQRDNVRALGGRCDIGAYELIPTPNLVNLHVGNPAPGSLDSRGSVAQFRQATGIAVNAAGTLALIADTDDQIIRKVDLVTGDVTTLAGKRYWIGTTDGISSTARFYQPMGIDLNAAGTLALVADTDNHTIRRINVPTAQVTTLAGNPGVAGSDDGSGNAAGFHFPEDVALSSDGTFALIADTGNHTIRKLIIGSGAVSTLAGSAGMPGYVDGIGSLARFNQPTGVSLSADGSFAVIGDAGNDALRKIDLVSGAVTTIADLPPTNVRAQGSDRIMRVGLVASVGAPTSPLGLAADQRIVVVDNQSQTVRQVIIATGEVTLLAGSPGAVGNVNAAGTTARFNQPADVVLLNNGTTALIADRGNNLIRRIDNLAAPAAPTPTVTPTPPTLTPTPPTVTPTPPTVTPSTTLTSTPPTVPFRLWLPLIIHYPPPATATPATPTSPPLTP